MTAIGSAHSMILKDVSIRIIFNYKHRECEHFLLHVCLPMLNQISECTLIEHVMRGNVRRRLWNNYYVFVAYKCPNRVPLLIGMLAFAFSPLNSKALAFSKKKNILNKSIYERLMFPLVSFFLFLLLLQTYISSVCVICAGNK